MAGARGRRQFDLKADPAQKKNPYATEPAKVAELTALMEQYITNGRSTPGPTRKNDVEIARDKRGK